MGTRKRKRKRILAISQKSGREGWRGRVFAGKPGIVFGGSSRRERLSTCIKKIVGID